MRTLVMYVGERLPLYGKPQQAFRVQGQAELRFFSGVKGVCFGDVYEGTAGPDERFSLSTRPTAIESAWRPSEQDEMDFETHKLLCVEYRAQQRKMMSIKRPHKDIQRAADLLRPFYKHLSDLDRSRFMRWFANEVSRKGRK